jgi:alpha/beta hydrolase fold
LKTLRIPVIALLALNACSAPGDGASPTQTSASRPVATAAPSSEPDPLATPTVDGLFAVGAGGRRIAGRCWGDGRVVILEGGGDSNIGQFGGSSLTRELARRARVCAFDHAGTGSSDAAPNRRRTADDVVEDLRAALEAADLGPPFVVVGSSFGGMVVTHFADRFDEDVSGVVTLDTPAPSNELTPENFPEGVWNHPANTQHLDVVHGFENRFALHPPVFSAPLIIVTATGGQSDVTDQAFWLQSSPDAHQVELPGGHEIYEDDADGVLAEILTLLSEGSA